MKKTFCIISATALLLVFSCTKVPDTPDNGLRACSFTASSASGDVKSSYYGEGTLIWNMWDEASVLDGYGNRRFITSDEGEKAVFSGEISRKATQLVAIYPYAAGNRLAGDGQAVAVFPCFQNAVPGGFCAGANPSLGVASVSEGESVYMHNLGAYLKFTIPEGGRVSAVFIKSNGGESLSGPLYVSYGGTEPVSATAGGHDFVTLVPRDSFTFASGTYYAVVNPVTLSSGLQFIARRPDGKIGVKSGSTANTLTRNRTRNLGTIDLDAMTWREDSLYANDTVTLDFSTQPFIEPLPTRKDSGIVEYHTPRGDCFVFRVDTAGTVRNTRGAGWMLNGKSGHLSFYPHTSAAGHDSRIIDGIQCPARADRRLKKVLLTVGGSASFKAMLYTMDGNPVAGGADTDASHFNANGNWKGGITASFELSGTKPGTAYNLVSASNTSFVYIKKLVYIYEKTLPVITSDKLGGSSIANITDGGEDFLW